MSLHCSTQNTGKYMRWIKAAFTLASDILSNCPCNYEVIGHGSVADNRIRSLSASVSSVLSVIIVAKFWALASRHQRLPVSAYLHRSECQREPRPGCVVAIVGGPLLEG